MASAGESTELPVAPSKNALKKAAKEKEKAEKAAARKAAEDKQRAETAANDVSAKDYGDLSLDGTSQVHTPLQKIAETHPEGDASSEGKAVVFRAVVENAREQSAKLTFLTLGHQLQTIQAVVAASETLSRQMVKFAGRIPARSTVRVYGVLKKPMEAVKSATISWLEVHITRIFVIGRALAQLPIQVEDCERPLPEEGGAGGEGDDKDEGARPLVALNTRLNNRVIDLMARLEGAIFEIKLGVADLFREYLKGQGFKEIWTPKIIGEPSEGGSSVFELKYFDQKAYLAQSPQLYKQMIIAAQQYERVFEIGPVFRAENSNTARHLTEFIGLDLEMAFDNSYHEVLDVLEGLLLHIFQGLRTRYAAQSALVRKTYAVDDFKLPAAGATPRIPFAEGVAMLRAAGVDMGEHDDLSTPHEKLLGKLVLDKYGTDFYILDQYPLAVRPFYTKPSATPGYSNSYDFHMRGQEILSGAQREHDADALAARMRGMDPPMDPEAPAFKDYVNAFRYGCCQHGGAGIGLERIVMLWLGLPNIRLASLFPRDPGRLRP